MNILAITPSFRVSTMPRFSSSPKPLGRTGISTEPHYVPGSTSHVNHLIPWMMLSGRSDSSSSSPGLPQKPPHDTLPLVGVMLVFAVVAVLAAALIMNARDRRRRRQIS